MIGWGLADRVLSAWWSFEESGRADESDLAVAAMYAELQTEREGRKRYSPGGPCDTIGPTMMLTFAPSSNMSAMTAAVHVRPCAALGRT